ncbi:hypothetical protein [Burkholderia ubonensis]|uniref:hypothetical protein n=1 Tax=Burkholderia ubonensis TaxID=101571 RepID=UPI000AAFF18D|nr:hypothetical protein [Burkholderia ubonensis]
MFMGEIGIAVKERTMIRRGRKSALAGLRSPQSRRGTPGNSDFVEISCGSFIRRPLSVNRMFRNEPAHGD